jgi:hypothetical protein
MLHLIILISKRKKRYWYYSFLLKDSFSTSSSAVQNGGRKCLNFDKSNKLSIKHGEPKHSPLSKFRQCPGNKQANTEAKFRQCQAKFRQSSGKGTIFSPPPDQLWLSLSVLLSWPILLKVAWQEEKIRKIFKEKRKSHSPIFSGVVILPKAQKGETFGLAFSIDETFKSRGFIVSFPFHFFTLTLFF